MSKLESSIKKYLENKGHQNLVIGLVKINTGAVNSINVPVTVASVCAEYMSSHPETASEGEKWLEVKAVKNKLESIVRAMSSEVPSYVVAETLALEALQLLPTQDNEEEG